MQEVLEGVIQDAGFEAELMAEAAGPSSERLNLRIEGMSCASCSSAAKAALQGVKGVQSAAVNLLGASAEVLTAAHAALAHVMSCARNQPA